MEYTCENCGHSFDFKGTFTSTNNLYCENCGCVILSNSDYGFGPVYPAVIYIGNKLMAKIKSPSDIMDGNGNKLNIKVPKELEESSYSKVFDICDFVYNEIIKESGRKD